MFRSIAVLILSVLASGCDMIAGPEALLLSATLTTGGPFQWDCNSVGCLFIAKGMNEGPSCATGVEGMVRFATKEGLPVLDATGSLGGATFYWRVHPYPDVPLSPGMPFELASTELIRQEIVVQVRTYQAVVTGGSVVDRC